MAQTPSLEPWRDLPFANRTNGLPKMLFRLVRTGNGFDLYVTDFIHAWKARDTSQAELQRKAARERCPIDPSEDSSQIDVLISKLEDGLSGSNRGRCKVGPGVRDTAQQASVGGFTLFTTTPLPAPLPPLRWRFELLQQDLMLLTSELLLPSLAAQLSYQVQAQDLQRRIKEKDHVIGRLMDKIEQSSIDLSLVFPGFGSGRKGLNAKQATKVVPGIAGFDVERWKTDFGVDTLAPAQSLVEALRKPGSSQLCFEGPRKPYKGEAPWNRFGSIGSWELDWIDTHGDDPVFTDEDLRQKKSSRAKIAPTLPFEESADAFEPPDTGPVRGLSKSSPLSTDTSRISSHRTLRASSTSSDDSPSNSRPTPPPRIGRLGGNRVKPQLSSPSPQAKRRTSSTSTATAQGLDSDSDSDSDSPPPNAQPKKASQLGALGGKKPPSQAIATRKSPSPPPPASSASTPSRKIGMLGGRKSQSVQPSSPQSPHTQHNPSNASTPSRRLGILGGQYKSPIPQHGGVPSRPASRHGKHEHDEDLDATDSPSSTPSPPAAQAPKPHPRKELTLPAPLVNEDPATAEEIADRKREELKRTLDTGGGRKKKRKF